MVLAKSTAKRGACRALFTKLYQAILPLFTAENVDNIAVVAKFRTLETKYQELTSLNELVVDELCGRDPSLTDEELEMRILAEAEVNSEYDEKYHVVKLKVEALSQPPPTIVFSDTENKTHIKLPKFEFRQFTGDISQWVGFWSQFEPVHLDGTLSDEEKFQYLVQATKPGSKARVRVESFPPSGKNYHKAIDVLKARFGRDELIVEHYVRELLNLVLSNATGRTSLDLAELSDCLETQLLALESFGVTLDKYASILYPLAESALPERVFRDWERYRRDVVNRSGDGEVTGSNPEHLMVKLRTFLQSEVVSDERVSHARETFKNSEENSVSRAIMSDAVKKVKVATAADLVSLQSTSEVSEKCIFCNSTQHPGEFCFKAREMSNNEKCKLLRANELCFKCLAKFHGTKNCVKEVHCLICSKKHCTAMCMGPRKKVEELTSSQASELESGNTIDNNCSNVNCVPILMQTLMVGVKGDNVKPVPARIMIDTGSQNSYVTRRLAERMKYKPIRQEKLVHALFGGVKTKVVKHNCYKIRLQSLTGEFSCNFDVLDSENICRAIPFIPKGPWLAELNKVNIPVTDAEGAIDILIGSDVAGRMFTGRKHELDSGLVAIETRLGWTISGRIRQSYEENSSGVTTLCSLNLSPVCHSLSNFVCVSSSKNAAYKQRWSLPPMESSAFKRWERCEGNYPPNDEQRILCNTKTDARVLNQAAKKKGLPFNT